MSNIRSVILGSGSYLPKKILSNNDLSKIVDTNDEWITTRTGIKQRHIAANNEFSSHMAINASKEAIKNSGIDAKDIDMIICATTTPDTTFPSTAIKVQAALDIKNCAGFDLQAVCSGFLYSISVADNFIKSGKAKNILVIGVDKMSSLVDWKDRSTCVLFGDGAGAVIISISSSKKIGIIDSSIHSEGKLESILYTDGGVSSTKTVGLLRMNGKEVFKHAVSKMSKSMLTLLENNNIDKSEIDHVIPHQANNRILEAVCKKMSLTEDKLISTVAIHANTSAASIPLAIDYGIKTGKIKKGDLVISCAVGAGLTWATCLFRL